MKRESHTQGEEGRGLERGNRGRQVDRRGKLDGLLAENASPTLH